MQETQREQFATLTLNTAVELTGAALKRFQVSRLADEQAIALRDAMRVLFPRRLRSSRLPGRASCASRADAARPRALGVFVVAALVLLVIPGPAVLYIVSAEHQRGRLGGHRSMLGHPGG
jgi:hypothetical protein